MGWVVLVHFYCFKASVSVCMYFWYKIIQYLFKISLICFGFECISNFHLHTRRKLHWFKYLETDLCHNHKTWKNDIKWSKATAESDRFSFCHHTSPQWLRRKTNLWIYSFAGSILKLKSIVIPLNQMSQSGEKHAQD